MAEMGKIGVITLISEMGCRIHLLLEENERLPTIGKIQFEWIHDVNYYSRKPFTHDVQKNCA